jgi:hypothetical protein
LRVFKGGHEGPPGTSLRRNPKETLGKPTVSMDFVTYVETLTEGTEKLINPVTSFQENLGKK